MLSTLIKKAFVIAIVIFNFGCMPNSIRVKESLDSEINIYSCLDKINKSNLDAALKLCNEILKKYPDNPKVIIDRSLIYNLKGENELSCKDVISALNLLEMAEEYIDPLVKYQIQVRHNSCTKR